MSNFFRVVTRRKEEPRWGPYALLLRDRSFCVLAVAMGMGIGPSQTERASGSLGDVARLGAAAGAIFKEADY